MLPHTVTPFTKLLSLVTFPLNGATNEHAGTRRETGIEKFYYASKLSFNVVTRA
jgi:hypothetical protein